jgi:phospholipid/cholesterol/gamma-HCH transport system substrate-binding protein
VQLAIFAFIAPVSVASLFLGLADGSRAVGVSVYDVKADFRDTSGLYPHALVTYRGADVGRVKSLDLSGNGVRVVMSLNKDAHIPTGTRAEIHSTSAVGEQYVDLVPQRSSGPYLSQGDTIPRADTFEMPQIAPVLNALNGMLKSVPQEETQRLLSQVDEAFGTSAEDWETLIDSSRKLVASAHRDVRATKELTASMQPFLTDQREIADDTAAYVASLASVAGQLRASDSDFESLLKSGPPAMSSVDKLTSRLEPQLPGFLGNLGTTGHVFNTYIPNIVQTLVLYPALVDRIQGSLIVHRSEGLVKLDIKTNFNNPPPCIKGYLPISERRDPSDTSLKATPTAMHCTLPGDAPQSVRGARNYPCSNDPKRRAASPAGCGLTFGRSR